MTKDNISFADFDKLDLRVGMVEKAQMVDGSTKLIKMLIDFGPEFGKRQIISGIAQWYKPRQLAKKRFIFIVNLAPKPMMGEESQGMMLCADIAHEPKMIPVNKNIPAGTLVR